MLIPCLINAGCQIGSPPRPTSQNKEVVVAGGNVGLFESVKGGGILSDAIITVNDTTQFVMGRYGKMIEDAPLLRLVMDEVCDDGTELQHVENLSVGGAKDFIVTPDGMGLVKVGSAEGIRESATYWLFIQSVLDAGFPTERIKDDREIKCIHGLKMHVTRKAVQREGMEKKTQNVLIADKLYLDEKPAAKKGAGAKAGAGSKTAPAPAPADAALIEEAKGILLQVLYAAEGQSLPKNKIIPPVLSLIKDNANKGKLTSIILGDPFLTLADGWTYEKGVLSVV